MMLPEVLHLQAVTHAPAVQVSVGIHRHKPNAGAPVHDVKGALFEAA